MIENKKLSQYVIEHVRSKSMDCHGIKPKVDSVDMDGAIINELSFGVIGSVVFIVIEVECHCPVCELCMTLHVHLDVCDVNSYILSIGDEDE